MRLRIAVPWVILAAIAGCRSAPLRQPGRSPDPAADAVAQSWGGAAIASTTGLTRIAGGAVGDDLFPAPLPGGDGVVFSSDRHSRELKLYLLGDAAAGALRLTHGAGNDIHAAVSPDGRSLVFASDRDGEWRIYRLSDIGGSSPPEALTEPGVPALHPAFDGTGERIAYMRRAPSGRWEVWIRSLADGAERFVAEGLFPEFHPTRERIILQRARDRDERWYSLHVVDLASGRELELVAGADWGAVNPSFSPDGRWVVFNSVEDRPADAASPTHGDDLWCMTETGERLTRLSETPRPEWNAVWGRDGRIYFTSAAADGRTCLWRMTPALPE